MFNILKIRKNFLFMNFIDSINEDLLKKISKYREFIIVKETAESEEEEEKSEYTSCKNLFYKK